MYRIAKGEGYIRLPPNMLDMDIKSAAKEIIKNMYRNKYLPEIGLVLDILNVDVEKDNLIVINDPYIYIKVKFDMVSFTIENKELILGVVREVVEYGAFVLIGPFEALLNVSQISNEKFRYNKDKKRLENLDGTKTIEVGDRIYAMVSTVSMKEGPAKAKISLSCRAYPYLGNIKWFNQLESEPKLKKKGKRA